MPYGPGRQQQAGPLPGVEVNRTVEGQQLYWNGLTGTRLLASPVEWTQNGAIAVLPFVGATPNSPIGDDLFWDLSGTGPADSLSQVLSATFDGGTVYIASVYVDASASTSTAARLNFVVGGATSTIDFNPLNGTIIATNGPGAFDVESFVVGNSTFLKVRVRVANPPAASPNSLELAPVVPPSVGGTMRVQAPQVAVTFDAALGLAANAVLFTDPAYVESNSAAVFPANGVSTPGAIPQYQSAAPLQIYAQDASTQLNFSGALAKTIAFPPGTTPSSKFVPDATVGGLEIIPPGWYCWFSQGAQPNAAPATIDFSVFGQTVYINGVEPLSGPTILLPSANFPSGNALLLYLGGNEWALFANATRREVHFPAAGAFSFAWPYGVDTIYAIGAAGGGGGSSNAIALGGTCGAGGGGGEAVLNFPISASGVVGTLFAVTVGAGGAGAALFSNVAGAAGGVTLFGAFLTLAGGGGASFAAGIAGGFGGQGGSQMKVITAAAIENGGDGGGNIAGGIGGVSTDVVSGAASLPARGGGGCGENATGGAGFAAQAGADGYLTLRW